VGEDPRYILAGRRVLEVFWLGYWLPRLDSGARHQLMDGIAELIRDGILETKPGHQYSLDEISAAVAQAESVGRQGKALLMPGR
jgi:NADPH:quinone reductase